MVGYEGMFEAYYDCIKRKRGSNNAMRFVLDFERNLVVLARRIPQTDAPVQVLRRYSAVKTRLI